MVRCEKAYETEQRLFMRCKIMPSQQKNVFKLWIVEFRLIVKMCVMSESQ